MANSILSSHASGTSNTILVSHGFPSAESYSNGIIASYGAEYTGGGSPDTTPAEFNFGTSPTGLALSAGTQTSDAATITGITAASAFTFSGTDGSCEWRKYTSGAWGSWSSAGSGSCINNDQLQLRHTAGTGYSQTVSGTITFTSGSVSATFSSTTIADPAGINLTHGSEFTITGSGFGTKPAQTPTFYWGGDGSTPTWDEVQGVSLGYQNSGWRASTPHARIARYAVGKRASSDTPPYNVVRSVKFPVSAVPAEVYASFYVRLDSAWDTSQYGDPDHQMKPCTIQWNELDYLNGTDYIYHGVAGVLATGNLTGDGWRYSSAPSGGSIWGEDATNPVQGWVRLEFIGRFATDGYLRLFETTSVGGRGVLKP
jgi:hypothetical protein